MSQFCHWYKGKPEEIPHEGKLGRNPAWADYQVLGPSFGAVSMLLGIKDILPVFVNARGCAFHTRFTKYAWGIELGMERNPLPYLEFTSTAVVNGNYIVSQDKLKALERITDRNDYRLLVLMASDNVILAGDSLEDLSTQIQDILKIPVSVLRVSGISGTNPWIGYDGALGVIYDQVWDVQFNDEERGGINLFGWKWPSRKHQHDIGACLELLEKLNVTVNQVLPGGASLANFADSLRSHVNLLWCSSYIGPTLERVEKEKGIKLAGRQTPYGFEGTMLWIEELAIALENKDLIHKGKQLSNLYLDELADLKNVLRGKRVFVSGGPGRIMGLLHLMADLEVEVVALALYWIHPETRNLLDKSLSRFAKRPEVLFISPSLYELEEVAQDIKPDVWLGGYQELHACKKYNIPFVPTTLYSKSHQGFKGCIHVGQKMIMAMSGHNFVANPFVSTE